MENIESILDEAGLGGEYSAIRNVEAHGYAYKNLYKALAKDGRAVGIKLRDIGKFQLRSSLECLSTMRDRQGLISRYVRVAETDQCYVLVYDWIDGVQPISQGRERIPGFFAALGAFNLDNPIEGRITSMYLDGRVFKDAAELVDAEFSELIAAYRGGHDRIRLKKAADGIKLSPACIIQEDMNAGNLIIDGSGKLRIIDTEFMARGLAVYQFDHVNLLGLEESKWYNVTDEAEASYEAFFKAIGAEPGAAKDQRKGFLVLQALRKMNFLAWKGEEPDTGAFDLKLEDALSR